ncbi:Beta-N-acetylhexosaminidase [uncultured Paludibacter sp.]|uniref:beta-N-acetylhexosaminidase n=1 Tax=uncultured Paludibacter sp. TaxID=497635 RepID=A0A653A9X3_9BACT|nr:Beta-N-acetylhexosaminidase [uncultured Paludibacter sp.]
MRSFITYLLLFISLFQNILAQSIIPTPSNMVFCEYGEITLTPSSFICFDKKLEKSSNFLNDYCQQYYGVKFNQAERGNYNTNSLIRLKYSSKYKKDSYKLTVNQKGVFIEGSETGVFYGIQSLLQLMEPSKANENSFIVHFVTIYDSPRFTYRGIMLDVSRHFFSIDFIKKMIDYAAYHKLNYFQLHLCDDQGWRLEIKSYPRLTQIGAWRNGTIIGVYPGVGNDNKRYGGYYTQEQIKEIVKYAAERYITIIPEIEMPGHCLAALSAYPYLGCTHSNYQVSQIWGYSKDVLCVGNDSVFTFLEKVMNEVIQLFPSKFIHIGGDECPTDRWKQCPKCQARMKKERISTERGLQTYLTKRIENYLKKKGRKIIVWDETLDDDIKTDAYIMSWRGDGSSGCVKGTSTNHKVIMTPSYGFYLDYPQTAKEDSLVANWGGVTSVKKVYNFEPVVTSVNPKKLKYVIGAQVNVWTEYMNNPKKVEYMIFPRLSAMSEVVWSPKSERDWNKFKQRMQSQYKRYLLWNANYNPTDLDSE